MSKEFVTIWPIGYSLYVTVQRKADNYYWNGSAFEAKVNGNWGTYDVPLTANVDQLDRYEGDFPVGITVDAQYVVTLYQRIGASPDVSDPKLDQQDLHWDGTKEITSGPVVGGFAVIVSVTVSLVAQTDAIVRATQGSAEYVAVTGSGGAVQFGLTGGSWQFIVTKYGYTFPVTTVNITSGQTVSIAGTAIILAGHSLPLLCYGYTKSLDPHGNAEPEQIFTFELRNSPNGITDSTNKKEFKATSDDVGDLRVEFLRNAGYRGRRGLGPWKNFDTGSQSAFTLPEMPKE